MLTADGAGDIAPPDDCERPQRVIRVQLEFYVRRLAKSGVRLVSITQELGDDPMSNMIRQIMALFDEYQSKENAKHTLRAMKENARQGFWNGALPPIGYRIVEAAEQRGHRTKKTLEIDPIQAETVRLIFLLAREGNGSSGPMGVKSIAKHLNESGIRTRDGGRWGVDAVHKVLTRTTYIGRHRFNTKYWKTRERKPEAEVVEMAVPPIIDVAEFEAIQTLLKTRCPALTAHRQRTDPPYRHLFLRCVRRSNDTEDREEREVQILHMLDQSPARRDWLQGPDRSDGKARQRRGRTHRASPVAAQTSRANPVGRPPSPERARRAPNGAYRRIAQACGRSRSQAQAALRRPRKRNRRCVRSDAQGACDRAKSHPRSGPRRRGGAEGALDRAGPSVTPKALKTFASQARRRMRTESGGYRRDHLRALAQRIEVDAQEVRIVGSKSVLLRTLVAASSAKTAGFGVPSFVPKWRARQDSNL
jgi:site-specific DNA recombinase